MIFGVLLMILLFVGLAGGKTFWRQNTNTDIEPSQEEQPFGERSGSMPSRNRGGNAIQALKNRRNSLVKPLTYDRIKQMQREGEENQKKQNPDKNRNLQEFTLLLKSPKIIRQLQQNLNAKDIQILQKDTIKTCGSPQGKPFNYSLAKPSDYYLYESLMDDVLKPYNDTDCQFAHYGDRRDGGYLMCKNFMKNSKALLNFGVEGRDNFGCDLTGQFKIPNLQYDCTNSHKPPCSKNDKNNKFNYICISNETKLVYGKHYESIKDIIDKNNLKNKHITIKIDIQGGQWPGFRSLPLDYLEYIDQIVMEVHNPGRGIYQRPYWGNVDIISSLGKYFRTVNLHMNNWACYSPLDIQRKKHKFNSFAIQVTMVNKKLLSLKKDTRSYKLNQKNINNGAFRDCQMTD